MKFRTRLASMVILLLLGCVFAAPFYHSATSPSEKPSFAENSLPTLQIQRDAPVLEVDEAKFEANTISPFPDTTQETQQPRTPNALAGSMDGSATTKSAISDSVRTGLAQSNSANVRSTPPKFPGVESSTARISRFDSPSDEQPIARVAALSVEPIPPLDLPPAVSDSSATLQSIQVQTSSGRATIPSGKIRSISNIGRPLGRTSQSTKIAWNEQPRFDAEPHQQPAVQPDSRTADIGSSRRRIDGASPRINQSQVRPQAEQSFNKRWHRVARFDTLNELSKKYYGTADFALHIFEANRETLISPAILPIGAELIIPDSASIRTPKTRDTRMLNQEAPLQRVAPQQRQERLRVEPIGSIQSVSDGWRRPL